MRVFVTDAYGHIGSLGHEVVGLARSDRSAAKLAAAGTEIKARSQDTNSLSAQAPCRVRALADTEDAADLCASLDGIDTGFSRRTEV